MSTHTVEKIGGTSMSRADELRDTLLMGGGDRDLYDRVFVVSAFGGITDLLLEQKKTGTPGVYGLFANSDSSLAWSEALDNAAKKMTEVHDRLLDHPADRRTAEDFLRERIEGARGCLIDLQRICSYGHFRLDKHMMTIRELLSGLGETHSAFTTALMLQRQGVNARFVDLTGWRDESQTGLDERIERELAGIDFTAELPIVTGYAQCREGLMKLYDRGYSEVTFARVAALTSAREAVIHKEFHLSSADPKIVGADAVRKIGQTNFEVADQLSNLGMEAIHPRAAKTLRQSGIPLRVANAFEPSDPGTYIDAEQGGEVRVEMVTGLDVLSLEVFEQDMVGVKGYDATILKALTRHGVRIVSKHSNANTITHYVDTSLKAARRVEREIAEAYPSARVRIHKVALVSAVGRNLKGMSVCLKGLAALEEGNITPMAMQQGARAVDVQFIVDRDHMQQTIRTLHSALVENVSVVTQTNDRSAETAELKSAA